MCSDTEAGAPSKSNVQKIPAFIIMQRARNFFSYLLWYGAKKAPYHIRDCVVKIEC